MAPIKTAYEGVLAQPIEYGALRSAQDANALASKIDVLCLGFGVDPHSVNRSLVFLIARRYVPGFQVGRARKPAQKKWNDVGLARLWMLSREAVPGFGIDKNTVAHICRQKNVRQFTGGVAPVWIQQLLCKAQMSPLVRMIESSNPADNQFALAFLAKHSSGT